MICYFTSMSAALVAGYQLKTKKPHHCRGEALIILNIRRAK